MLTLYIFHVATHSISVSTREKYFTILYQIKKICQTQYQKGLPQIICELKNQNIDLFQPFYQSVQIKYEYRMPKSCISRNCASSRCLFAPTATRQVAKPFDQPL